MSEKEVQGERGEDLRLEDLLPAGTYGRLESEFATGKYLVVFIPETMSARETVACMKELMSVACALAESFLPEEDAAPDAGTIFSSIMDDPERQTLFMQKVEANPVLRPLFAAFKNASALFEEPGVREAIAAVFVELGFQLRDG